MSDYASLRKAIENGIFGSYTETPIDFEEQKKQTSHQDELIKVFVIIADSAKAQVTGPDSIETGAVMVQIFVKKNRGSKRMDELMALLKGMLADQNGGDDNLFINAVRPVDVEQSGTYYQKNLEAGFIFSYQT